MPSESWGSEDDICLKGKPKWFLQMMENECDLISEILLSSLICHCSAYFRIIIMCVCFTIDQRHG